MSWVDSLSLEALYRAGTRTEGRHALIMLGLSQAMWHLEMVEDANGEMPPSSTDEDLLVLYVGGPIDDDAVGRLVHARRPAGGSTESSPGSMGSHDHAPRRPPTRIEPSPTALAGSPASSTPIFMALVTHPWVFERA